MQLINTMPIDLTVYVAGVDTVNVPRSDRPLSIRWHRDTPLSVDNWPETDDNPSTYYLVEYTVYRALERYGLVHPRMIPVVIRSANGYLYTVIPPNSLVDYVTKRCRHRAEQLAKFRQDVANGIVPDIGDDTEPVCPYEDTA